MNPKHENEHERRAQVHEQRAGEHEQRAAEHERRAREDEERARAGTLTAADRASRSDRERDRDYRDRDDGDRSSWERSRSSAELERDIDRTRDRIEMRARQLEDRLSPGALFDRAVERLRHGDAGTFFSNLARDARDNPLPLLVTGVGIAWLMTADARQRRYGRRVDYDDLEPIGEQDDDGPSVTERVRSGARRAREGMHHMKERAGEVGSGISHAARASRDTLSSVSHSVGDGVDRLRHGWNRMVEEQPLLLGLFGLAAGAAIAAALPSTEMEDELMGEKSDQLVGGAARKTRELAAEARERVLGDEGHGGDGDRGQRKNVPSSGSKGANGGASSTTAFGSQVSDPPSPRGSSERDRPGQGSPFGSSEDR